jgi:superfamily II DNA or RNA helicase
MAEKLPLANIEDEDKEYLQSTLEIDTDECFDVDEMMAYIPFAFARQTFVIDKRESVARECGKFTAQLRDEQTRIKTLALSELNDSGSIVIAAHPGFGKTITAISIACELNTKTVIIVNKLVLIEQWKDAIAKFTTGCASQYVTSRTLSLDPTASIYIVNAINIRKKSRSFWREIEFMIVDELHQIVTKNLTKALLLFTPNYVLGLSATPYRFDEYDRAIAWFFGKRLIGKKLNAAHTATIIKTGFTPTRLKYTRQGVDWNSVLMEQSENDKRNDIIVNAVLEHPARTWMILVKRVAHATILVEKFNAAGVECTTLLGSAISFDVNCKILIGTTSKIGVGFDHAAIDALCIAADVKNYFVQFLGRCMRRPDCKPIVVDFDDEYGPLKRHLEERIKDYKKHGGIVRNA